MNTTCSVVLSALLLAHLAACADAPPVAGPDARLGEAECLSPASVDDPDIRRAASRISALGLCVTGRRFSAGRHTWQVYDIDSGRRGPLHVVPHDDENAALPIALHAIDRLGGRIVVIEANEQRFFAGVDPNRYFANERASARGCPFGAPDPAFAREMLRGAPRTVIAYHSNDEGYAGDGRGGSGTISVLRETEQLKPLPATGTGPRPDADNVVILAGRQQRPSGRMARDARRLNEAGVNVIYEVVAPRTDDCSLSNHFALTGGQRYFNVEVGHGDVAGGRQMVDALARLI